MTMTQRLNSFLVVKRMVKLTTALLLIMVNIKRQNGELNHFDLMFTLIITIKHIVTDLPGIKQQTSLEMAGNYFFQML